MGGNLKIRTWPIKQNYVTTRKLQTVIKYSNLAGSILSVESNQNVESKTKNVESKTEKYGVQNSSFTLNRLLGLCVMFLYEIWSVDSQKNH